MFLYMMFELWLFDATRETSLLSLFAYCLVFDCHLLILQKTSNKLETTLQKKNYFYRGLYLALPTVLTSVKCVTRGLLFPWKIQRR